MVILLYLDINYTRKKLYLLDKLYREYCVTINFLNKKKVSFLKPKACLIDSKLLPCPQTKRDIPIKKTIGPEIVLGKKVVMNPKSQKSISTTQYIGRRSAQIDAPIKAINKPSPDVIIHLLTTKPGKSHLIPLLKRE